MSAEFTRQEREGELFSFVDDVTWIVYGRSVREVRAKLEGAVRRAVAWGSDNGVAFELAKTEAILFSRNRRH